MKMADLTTELHDAMEKLEARAKKLKVDAVAGARSLGDDVDHAMIELRAMTHRLTNEKAPELIAKIRSDMKDRWARIEQAWEVLTDEEASQQFERARRTMERLDEVSDDASDAR